MAMAMGAPNINDFVQAKTDLSNEYMAICTAAEAGKRGFSADENTRLDAIKTELAANDKAIEREEFKLKLERDKAGSGVVIGQDRNALAPWKDFEEHLCAIRDAGMIVAGAKPGFVDPRLLRPQAAVSGASEGIPADAGYLVDKPFAPGLMQRAYDSAAVASRCARDPITAPGSNGMKYRLIDESSRANGSRLGGITFAWDGEGDQITGSKPKFRIMSMELKRLTGMFYATEEIVADAGTLTSVINREFPLEAAFKIDDAIIRGTGAGQPLGVLNSGALVSVAKESGQAAATIVAQNIIAMESRLWPPSLASAVWFINQNTKPQLHTMSIAVGTGGSLVYMPANGLSGSPYGTLFGRPVIPIEQCATLGTVGDIMLLDMSQFQLIDKGGVDIASSIHLRFDYNEMVWRFIVRLDGQTKWNAPLTPFKGTATLSPFIALATRA